MIEIRSAGAPSAPAPVERQPASRREPEAVTKPPLDPAVTLDLGRGAPSPGVERPPAPPETETQARFRRDLDSRQMVFQVIDPGSGSVLAQLPSEAALRARTYARDAIAAASSEIGTTVARTA